MSSRLTTPALWDLPRVGPPSADDSGSVVVVPVTTVTDEESTTRLWRVRPGADPVALTHGQNASGPVVAPDGRHVAFVRTVDEQRQVFVLPLGAGGEARQVTDLPLGVVGSARWAGPDRLLVVTRLLEEDPTVEATAAWHADAESRPEVRATERRLTRAWDTWYADPLTEHVMVHGLGEAAAEPQDLTPGSWLLPDPLADPAAHTDVSPDGRWLAFTSADPDGDDDGVPVPRLHVVDLDEPGAPRCLTPDTAGPAGLPRFLPDGRIAVVVRRERDWYAAPQDLWAVDPTDGTREGLLVDHDEQLGSLALGPDGRIVLGSEVRGRGRLFEVVDGAVQELPAPTEGGLASPVVTRNGVYALHSGLTAPPEVVRVADQVQTLTMFARLALDDTDLGTVEERWITGADQDEVQVFVLHPPTSDEDGDGTEGSGPLPLVHLVHGGPHGTFGDTWHWRWCAARFAAKGWVVAMVNFHGSTSFGHDFTRSIHGDWATKPTEDMQAATDALVTDGVVDETRMAIIGGSYGGYLTVWLTTQTDRYRVAVAHAAVTDFGGMWATDWTNGFADAFGGYLWEDPVRTYRFSPSWHYGGMSTPMLVLHGDRDLRVPIDQGRALYGVLQSMRIPSRLVVFPHENHWVLDRRNSTRWYEEVLGWLHQYLDE